MTQKANRNSIPATYKPMGLKELFESELAPDLKTSYYWVRSKK